MGGDDWSLEDGQDEGKNFGYFDIRVMSGRNLLGKNKCYQGDILFASGSPSYLSYQSMVYKNKSKKYPTFLTNNEWTLKLQ